MEEAQQQVEKRQRRQGDEEFLPGHGHGGDEGPVAGDGQGSRVEEPGDKIAEGRGRQGAQKVGGEPAPGQKPRQHGGQGESDGIEAGDAPRQRQVAGGPQAQGVHRPAGHGPLPDRHHGGKGRVEEGHHAPEVQPLQDEALHQADQKPRRAVDAPAEDEFGPGDHGPSFPVGSVHDGKVLDNEDLAQRLQLRRGLHHGVGRRAGVVGLHLPDGADGEVRRVVAAKA